MLGTTFYHNSIRNLVASFGNLFNEISIERRDNLNVVQKTIRIPISYSPKEKYLQSIRGRKPIDGSNPDLQNLLPRMGFDMVGLNPAIDRQLTKINKAAEVDTTDITQVHTQFQGTPYDFSFELYISTKHTEDGLMIMEQILPFFSPDFTINILAIPKMDIKQDAVIILDSVSPEVDYEGSFDGRRIITWVVSFTVKSMIFGPIVDSKIIRKAITKTFDFDDSGLWLENESTPNPITADADDPHTITKTNITDNTND